jgi:hypothetical protein
MGDDMVTKSLLTRNDMSLPCEGLHDPPEKEALFDPMAGR